MAGTEPTRPFARRTERVIGRGEEIEAIKAAIADNMTDALYYYGPGGIGKTRLLEEVKHIQREWEGEPFLWSGIIDLYHSDFHRVGGIQETIAQALDPAGQHFSRYHNARERFEEHRAVGVFGKELEQERRELRRIFIENYNQLAGQRRIVLSFDTLERVQYESDPVQSICQIEEEAVEVKNWIRDEVSQMQNTVVLLAGRPQSRLLAELRSAFSGDGRTFQTFELGGLTEDEALAYFNAMADIRPEVGAIPEDIRRRIWEYTQGHPIRLSLVIDLTAYGDISGLFLPDHSRETVPAELDERLITELLSADPPVRDLLHYLAQARKGLSAELLHQLEPDWSVTECQQNLDRMRRFTFVKPRPSTQFLFLHDELYHLFDRFVLRERQFFRNRYETLAEYHLEKLKRAEEAGNREAQQSLKVDALYYKLQVDPWEAFWRYYVRWDDEAIKGFEVGFDMRLRDELLHFLEDAREDPWVQRRLPREVVDRDSAARWVRRYLSRADHDRAIEVAETILALGPETFRSFVQEPQARTEGIPGDLQEQARALFEADDLLFWGHLLTYYGEALAYVGAPEEQVMPMLQQVVRRLTGESPDPVRDWLHTRVLGRAHNNIGYVHRAVGRFGAAFEEYKKSLPYFVQAEVEDEEADTRNNMAYTLALLGRVDLALEHMETTLEIRERLGHPYPLALSYNTQGLIHVLDDHPTWGERQCQQALDIFEELQEFRGIGLACIGRGFALRKQGDQWKLGEAICTQDEADDYFSEAVKALERAVHIFTEPVDEPLRLWEAYNELGSTYCDWGWLVRQREGKEAAQPKYAQSVNYQTQAYEVAKQHELEFAISDSCDDLAQVWADRGDFEEAHLWLERAQAPVPSEYEIVKGQGFPEVTDPWTGYWLVLGKAHLQRGIWAFRGGEWTELASLTDDERLEYGMREFALSVAYFQRYWPRSYAMGRTLRSFTRYVRDAGVLADRARETVRQVAEEYQVNLDILIETINDILGI